MHHIKGYLNLCYILMMSLKSLYMYTNLKYNYDSNYWYMKLKYTTTKRFKLLFIWCYLLLNIVYQLYMQENFKRFTISFLSLKFHCCKLVLQCLLILLQSNISVLKSWNKVISNKLVYSTCTNICQYMRQYFFKGR